MKHGGRHSLTRTALSGVAWLLAQNLGARLIGFASQIALAKILIPADFALLALAGTVVTIVGAVVAFGVEDVLLQRQKTLRFWTTAAFFTSLGLSLIGMLLVGAASPFAAKMYRTPE